MGVEGDYRLVLSSRIEIRKGERTRFKIQPLHSHIVLTRLQTSIFPRPYANLDLTSDRFDARTLRSPVPIDERSCHQLSVPARTGYRSPRRHRTFAPRSWENRGPAVGHHPAENLPPP